jgi:hypothetical protein
MSDRTLRLTVSAAADRSLTTVMQPLVDSVARAKAKIAADAESMAKSMQKSGTQGAGYLGKEFDKAAQSGTKAYSQIEAASARAAAKEAADASRKTAAVSREELKAFDAKLKASQRASEASAKANAREATDNERKNAKILRDNAKVESQAAKVAAREVAENDRKNARMVRDDQKAFDTKLRLSEQASSRAQKLRDRENGELLREGDRVAKSEARKAAHKNKSDTGAQDGRRMSIASGAYSSMSSIGSAAMGFGGSMAGGLGLDFDVGSAVNKSVALRAAASQLSISAFQGNPGEKRVDPKELQKISRDVGTKSGFDPMKVMEGMTSYVGKTGDLGTAKESIGELAHLARATGTDIGNMIDASGDVGNALGEVGEKFGTSKEKSEAVLRVMRMIAGQGKVGAVEVKDLAVQMAKLSSASISFGGNREKNLGNMGALIQMARQLGGAASATAAATSVVGFVNTLKTPGRIKEFKDAGVDVFERDKQGNKTGKFNDAFVVIKQALKASGGDPELMKKMFSNVVGAKGADAITGIYNDAGGITNDKSGQAAVDKYIEKFTKPLSKEQEDEDYAQRMLEDDVKAQQFQSKLDTITDSLVTKLLPSLEKLAPVALDVAAALSRMIEFAASNPAEAIILAITASIAKAAIGDAVGSVIQGLIKSSVTSAGNLPLALSIGMATFAITKATIEIISEQVAKGQNTAVNKDAEVANTLSAHRMLGKNGSKLTKEEDLKNLEAAKETIGGQNDNAAGKDAYAQVPNVMSGSIFDLIKSATSLFNNIGEGHQNKGNKDLHDDSMKEVVAAINSLKNGIPVTNMPNGGLTSQAGTVGVPGPGKGN